MSISKRYLKTKAVGKVTFKLTKKQAKSASAAFVVGEFNNWNPKATPMKKLKNGAFTTTVDLKKGTEYRFRYLLDNTRWENDNSADGYSYCEFAASDNSIVKV